MLTRSDFIQKIFTLYSKDFTGEENKRAWLTAYDSILDKRYDVDYDKLYKMVLLEHKSKNTAPSASFIAELVPKCKVFNEIKTDGVIELGGYEFTKVSADWNCKTVKQVQQELENIA